MTVSDSLVTIPDVEILSTGNYSIASPGEITFTTEDLEAVLASQSDPYVHSPRLKIGHTSEFGDGEPSFGKVTNMRLSADGQTLIGDYTGVPKWLAEIMPSAYPSRSIEGGKNVTTPDGKTHGMVIEAVALLGVVAPGVATLEDLAGLYEETAPDGLTIAASQRITAKIGGEAEMGTVINAAIEVEDVRREYYEQLSEDQMWWWIRAVELDPAALIVDSDAGSLYRVPFEIDGDNITFGDQQEVQIEYVPVGTEVAAQAAQSSGRMIAVFASRSESRPTSTDKETIVEMSAEQLKQLGLSEDASQEDLDARLAELAPAESTDEATEEATTETESTEEATEEQTADAAVPALASVDPATLDQMRADAQLGREARQKQLDDERDSAIDAAVKAGKFPPSRKAHWQGLWANDPDGTRETIANLAPGLIPVNEGGDAGGVEAATTDDYPSSWLSPQEKARLAAAQSGDRTSERVIQEAR